MSDIVKYHNDFNKIKLPSFTELEQNLLCAIFLEIKEKGHKETIKFPVLKLKKIALQSNLKDDKQFNSLMESLFYKFFKADFTILIKDEKGREGKTFVNLFEKVTFWNYNKLLEEIEIKVNEDFSYLVNSLTKEFTGFELAEFVALSGKYTKTLYRLLKQYRTTGTARFEWNEFCRIMDIPEKLAMCDIDKRILKPAIKELSKERNLFDQIRVPFKNLAYEKEKEKGTRGRGGKVSAIIFSFKPENSNIQKLEKEVNKKATLEQKIIHTCNEMLRTKIKFEYEDKIYQVLSFDIEKLSLQCVEMIRDEYENLVNSAYREFIAKDKEQFKRMLDIFMNEIR
ncbi:replication initiation protein [Campylobacter jejuni]|nr:replication initiation protein [Campylobacter jejuni]MBZ7933546.1 replication initiation protein [Campylobacter sp. RM10543]MBZ7951721.1 replication initiation protein [Campylobacter sp. W0046]MBZ7969394.1 replication initiation protein [Campylobacter sp. RM9759]EDP4101142.1 RepB family plasmid replication initiator protein [Campylobacter jejuni]